MIAYLRLFKNRSEYEANIDSVNQSINVVHCIEENEVHYIKNEGKDNKDNLVVRYYVEDDSESTKLYYCGHYFIDSEELWISGADVFDNVIIDGNNISIEGIDEEGGFYQLSEGEHTIEYVLKDQTSIPTYLFMMCPAIVSVDIPSGVKYIGIITFGQCINLKNVNISDSVTEIDFMAFSNCSGLTSIIIPNGVTVIGNSAFSGCKSLSSITIGNNVSVIGEGAFNGCSITSVTIPDNVETIGAYAFANCSSLLSLTIPYSVTNIGEAILSNCCNVSLVEVDVSNSIYDSRNNCNAIVKTDTNELIVGCKITTIPSTITSVGNRAFSNCVCLSSITIPNSVTSIGDGAFQSCSSLTDVTIPNSVTSIGDSAFDGCVSLENIEIPNSVTNLGIDAFGSCRNLVSISLPDSITTISNGLINRCTNLTSMIIPSSVTSIGSGVFTLCESLTSIYCLGMTAPSIDRLTFRWIAEDGVLYVPNGSVGYDEWMKNEEYYLGYYNWTITEQGGVDPFNGHEYVEIGGLKWATMNVGATNVTDAGLLFQWGDIQGYNADQVGNGDGKKYFGWADYKYGNGTSSQKPRDMVKYNNTDGKTILDFTDDAVRSMWGGSWRMPTKDDFLALKNAVNTTWTNDYQDSGVGGMICTDKTDNSKVLFFPGTHFSQDGYVLNSRCAGTYWSSSLYKDKCEAYQMVFTLKCDASGTNVVNWENWYTRYFGLSIRGVIG